MKIIHRDPALHAQRVAAIKKAKGTAAARKHTSETLKIFFSDPENRRKRSISMKGVKFFCKNCGQEGHRSNYCPERVEKTDGRFKCGLCGEKGHNRRTCGKPRIIKVKKRILGKYHCRACGKVGHNRQTCSLKTELQSHSDAYVRRGYLEDSKEHVRKHHHHCSICGKVGHNRKTCTLKTQSNSAAHDDNASHKNSKGEYRGSLDDSKKYRSFVEDSKGKLWDCLGESEGQVHNYHHHCSVCGKVGHNRRTCSLKTEQQLDSTAPENRGYLKDAKGEFRGSLEVSKGDDGGSLKDPKGEYRGFLDNSKGKYRGSLKDSEGENRGSLEASKGLDKGFLEDSNEFSCKHHHHCSLCGEIGHNRRTCSLKTELESDNTAPRTRGSLEDSEGEYKGSLENIKAEYKGTLENSKGDYRGSLEDSKDEYRGSLEDPEREYRGFLGEGLYKGALKESNVISHKHHRHCSLCGEVGHNRRTCSLSESGALGNKGSLKDSKESVQTHFHHCSVCRKSGHNRRTCSESPLEELDVSSRVSKRARSYHCGICGVHGHNRRTCVNKRGLSIVNIEENLLFEG